jgi:hypothetical protein
MAHVTFPTGRDAMRVATVVCVGLVSLLGRAVSVEAQTVSHSQERPPRFEAGTHLGLWTLEDGGAEFGFHLTHNRSGRFGFEYGVSHRPGLEVRKPSTLAQFNVRFSARLPEEMSGIVFLTLGAVAGNSANFSVSPTIGSGIQVTPSVGDRPGIVMVRIEFQFVTLGRHWDDHGRFMLGLVVPIHGRWTP